MRIVALVLLALVGCSRSFTAPQLTARVDGIFLPGSSEKLPSGAAVSAVAGDGTTPSTFEIHGDELSGATDVLVSGEHVGFSKVSASELTFDAPSAVSVGESVSVAVQDAAGSHAAGSLRFYAKPVIASVDKPVSAPGQVFIKGNNFSPAAAENLVTVGGVPVDVVVSTVDRLVVQLDGTVPEGPQPFVIRVVPDAALPPPASSPVNAVVWKVVPAFWTDPPQLFAGQQVRFRAYNSTLQASAGSGALSDVVDSAGQTDAGSLDLGAALEGASSDGGAPLVNSLAANYLPDDAGASTQGPDTDVPARTGLSIALDGLDTGLPPSISLRDEALSWVVPPDLSAGAHRIALSDPAGSSPSAELVILQGHLGAPSPSCRPLDFAPMGALAQGLHNADTAGNVVLWSVDGAGTLDLRTVHPGGAVESVQIVGAKLDLLAAVNRLVAAGRDYLYIEGKRADDGSIGLLALPSRPGAGAPLVHSGTTQAGFATVLEPSTQQLDTSVLEAGVPVASCNWSGTSCQLNQVQPPDPPGCTVASGALVPGLVTVAEKCAAKIRIGRGPPGAVVTQPLPLPGTPADYQLTAQPQGSVLIASDAGAWLGNLDPQNQAQQVPVASGPVSSVALSPDGEQALAGGQRSLEVRTRVPTGDWVSGGTFQMDGTVTTLAYDAAGTHAVGVVDLDDGGRELCDIH